VTIVVKASKYTFAVAAVMLKFCKAVTFGRLTNVSATSCPEKITSSQLTIDVAFSTCKRCVSISVIAPTVSNTGR
jgi:hypothetical protein